MSGGKDSIPGFNLYLEEFINYLTIERGLSPNTTSSYRSDLEKFIAFLSVSYTHLTLPTN